MDKISSVVSINGSSPSTMASIEKCTLASAMQNTKRSGGDYGSLAKSKFEPTYYISHEVKSDDTIQRLALKYSINVQDIKKVNKLWSDGELTLLKNVYIPVNSSQLSILRTEYPTLNIIQNPSPIMTHVRKSSANAMTNDETASFIRTSESLSSLKTSYPSYQDYFSKIDQQIQTSRKSLQSLNIPKQYLKSFPMENSAASNLSNDYNNNEKKYSQTGRSTFWNNSRHKVGQYVSDKNVFMSTPSQNSHEKYVTLALERIQREKDDFDEL